MQAESKDEAEKPSESAEKSGGDKTEAADKVKKEGGEASEREEEESEEGGEAKSSAPSGNCKLRPPVTDAVVFTQHWLFFCDNLIRNCHGNTASENDQLQTCPTVNYHQTI